MATPNSTIITKLSNGNILVTAEGGDYTLLSNSYLTKYADGVIVRGSNPRTTTDFKFATVEKVIREDTTEIVISDADTLFTELRTHFFFLASGDGAAAFNQRLIFVDETYGVDGTAVNFDPSKPYKTIQAAITAASSGDNLHVFPGTYSGTIIVKDGVNIHCEAGAIMTGIIKDNTVKAVMNWTGEGVLDSSSSNTLDFRGMDTDVSIEFISAKTSGNALMILNPGANNLNFKLRALNLEAGQTMATVRGGANYDIEVSGRSFLSNAATFNRFIDARNTFSGKGKFTSKEYVFSNNTSNYDRIAYISSVSGTPKLEFHGDLATSVTTVLPSSIDMEALVYTQVDCDIVFEIKEVKTVNRSLILAKNSGASTTKVEFNNVRFESTEHYAIRIAKSFTNHIFNNCHFRRDSGGADLNSIIGIGLPAALPTISGGQTDNLQVEFINCSAYNRSAGADLLALVHTQGASTDLAFKNCDIISVGTGTPTTCDADALPDGKIYFKNTNSNIDNTVNIEDTAVVSGFTGNDLKLKVTW